MAKIFARRLADVSSAAIRRILSTVGPRMTCSLQPARARTESPQPGVFWIIHRCTPTDVCRVDLGPTAGLLARGSAPRPAFPEATAASGARGRDYPLTVAGAAAD